MESILKVLNVVFVASLAAASIGCVIDVEGFEATEEDQRVFSVSGTPDVTLSLTARSMSRDGIALKCGS